MCEHRMRARFWGKLVPEAFFKLCFFFLSFFASGEIFWSNIYCTLQTRGTSTIFWWTFLSVSLKHCLTLTLSQTLPHTLSIMPTLSHTFITWYIHTFSLTLTKTPAHSNTLFFTDTLSLTLTHTLPYTHTHSASLTIAHSLTHSSTNVKHSLTHIQAHGQSLSLSPTLLYSNSLSYSHKHTL